jgi:hypothetical protein
LREHHCEQFRSIPFTTQVQGLLDATFSRDSSIEHALPITGGLVGGQTNQAIAQTG